MLFGAVTLQAWYVQALQQIACEKCGLKTRQDKIIPVGRSVIMAE
jgi:hypothetical protein